MAGFHRVVWHKGMFLTPQHFQAQDKASDDDLQFRLSAGLFANWGVTKLTVKPEALANGSFQLTEAAGVFRDGLPFNAPGTDALPGSRSDVAKFFERNAQSVNVYLCVPEEREGHSYRLQNGRPGAGGDRYLVSDAELADDAGTGDSKRIQIATGNLQLLLGDESRNGFVPVQIARVVLDEKGKYALDANFIPPCLDIAASGALMSLLARQMDILLSKADALNAARRQRGRNLVDFNAAETARFWLLHTVNTSLPELKHIYRVRQGHPEFLYMAMLRLAGALSTFSFDTNIREIPDYKHDDLETCFGVLDKRIRDLLETVIPSKCTSIALKLVDKATWGGQIASDEQLRNTQFYLGISANREKIGIDDLIKRTPDKVKIASSNDIQKLVSLALPGLKLRHVSPPPDSIPLKSESQYFALNQAGAVWEGIARSRSICIVPADIPDAKLEILVVSD